MPVDKEQTDMTRITVLWESHSPATTSEEKELTSISVFQQIL